MTRTVALALALLLVLAVAGCGEKDEPTRGPSGGLEPLTLMLDYFPNADHAGIYAAQASGEFRRAGLDVRIVTPPDPAAPLKLLQARRADLAITYEPELLLARDKGADVVSVGAIVQKPLTSVISLDDRIRSVRDLKGKRVGTAGIPYQSAYLKTILEDAGIDPGSVKETNVGFNLVPAMLTKKVDATLGAFWNYEGTDLRQRDRKPTILRMEQLGVPTYAELVLAVRRSSLDRVGASRVRRFLQALSRGHTLLRDRPEVAVDSLLDANRELKAKLQREVVRVTLPVFFPTDRDRPFGWQEPREWADYAAWMQRNGLLKRSPNAGRALTNEFLPGEGLDPGVAGRDT
jgi:putative hydroxymethylpyrimidine transport system substrate-binding protein